MPFSAKAIGWATNLLDVYAVMNDANVCTKTASGVTVDANGCSCSQLDADNDDMDDRGDVCARKTVGGTSEHTDVYPTAPLATMGPSAISP